MWWSHKKIFSAGLAFFLCTQVFCGAKPESGSEQIRRVKMVQPRVVAVFPHDSTAFTQGLLYHDGRLYESTGLHGKSSIRMLDTAGTVLKSLSIPDVFAEGCALFNGAIYQITWQEQTGIVYTPDLQVMGTFSYDGEGWGLTSDSVELIMSNGSDTLYFRNNRFQIQRSMQVLSEGKPLTKLNELEFARGVVYANVWFSDFIFEISPQNGEVQRIIDCSAIVAEENPQSDQHVLNGIAYVPSSDLFYVTGKNWKKLFLIEIPQE